MGNGKMEAKFYYENVCPCGERLSTEVDPMSMYCHSCLAITKQKNQEEAVINGQKKEERLEEKTGSSPSGDDQQMETSEEKPFLQEDDIDEETGRFDYETLGQKILADVWKLHGILVPSEDPTISPQSEWSPNDSMEQQIDDDAPQGSSEKLFNHLSLMKKCIAQLFGEKEETESSVPAKVDAVCSVAPPLEENLKTSNADPEKNTMSEKDRPTCQNKQESKEQSEADASVKLEGEGEEPNREVEIDMDLTPKKIEIKCDKLTGLSREQTNDVPSCILEQREVKTDQEDETLSDTGTSPSKQLGHLQDPFILSTKFPLKFQVLEPSLNYEQNQINTYINECVTAFIRGVDSASSVPKGEDASVTIPAAPSDECAGNRSGIAESEAIGNGASEEDVNTEGVIEAEIIQVDRKVDKSQKRNVTFDENVAAFSRNEKVEEPVGLLELKQDSAKPVINTDAMKQEKQTYWIENLGNRKAYEKLCPLHKSEDKENEEDKKITKTKKIHKKKDPSPFIRDRMTMFDPNM